MPLSLGGKFGSYEILSHIADSMTRQEGGVAAGAKAHSETAFREATKPGHCVRRSAILYFGESLEDQMGSTNKLGWTVVAVLSCALPAIAHHAFSAEFDSGKTVTLHGVVSKVDWINPHIFVYVDVKDDSGKTTTWQLQSLPPLFFRGSGLTKDVLLSSKQEVTITANPAKDGTQAYGFMTKLSYPDGHVFSMSPQDADPSLRKTQK